MAVQGPASIHIAGIPNAIPIPIVLISIEDRGAVVLGQTKGLRGGLVFRTERTRLTCHRAGEHAGAITIAIGVAVWIAGIGVRFLFFVVSQAI